MFYQDQAVPRKHDPSRTARGWRGRGRIPVHGGCAPDKSPPPSVAPKPRANPKITGAETDQEEPGWVQELTGTVHSLVLPRLLSLNVLREKIAVDIKYKTRKRKIRGGRRHRRRRKTTPWFDLNEFSSALLFLCLVCARSSCSLFFYSTSGWRALSRADLENGHYFVEQSRHQLGY